ncbi:MAG TPA: DUF4156 domain-containing protein, partial [Chromatiales bacterium]|nr:DUF4156 domain-containing protein [Chromatiales bacterium]
MRLVLLLTLFLGTACTWVKLAPDADQVRLATQAEVAGCKQAGITTVSVKADVASFARNSAQVQTELETLARNEAVKLKGDTIVPATAMKDGE